MHHYDHFQRKIFLPVFLLVLLLTQAVFAADSGTDGTCSWKISNGTLSIYPTTGSSCKLAAHDSAPDWADFSRRGSITKITITGKVIADSSSNKLFYYMSNLTDISGLKNLDVSGVINIQQMFFCCSSLTDLTPLQSWNVSNVRNMNGLFEDCTSLTDLTPLKSWKVSNVTDMQYMFEECKSLTDVTPLQSWSVSKVWDMSYMFYQCTGLKTVKFSDLVNLRYIDKTFYGCSALETVNLSNLSKLTSTERMFSDCTGLKTVTMSGLASVTNMSEMFSGCHALKTINLSGLAKATDMEEMFRYCKSLTDLTPLQSWNVANVTDMASMFYGCSSLTDLTPIQYWNIANVTDMDYMFVGTNGNCSGESASGLSAADIKEKCFKPAPVTGLKASISGTTAKLSWTALSGAKSYEIYRSTSATSGFAKIGTGTSTAYNASGLSYGKTYYFKVRALLTNGKYNEYSSVVKAAMPNAPVSGLKATVSGTTAKLSWSKLSGAKTYSIYQSTSATSGFTKIGTVSSTSYSAKSLSYGKTYYFKVRALLTNSQYSSYSAAVKAAIPKPSVSGLKATVSGTTAKLSWSKLSGAKTYYVYRSTSATSGFEKIGSASSTSYSVKSLSYGKTYYFKVRAKMSTGDYSQYSAVVKAAVPVPQVSGLEAELSGTTAKLSWSKLSGAKTYYVYRSTSATSGFEKIGSASSTSYSAKSLKEGKTYYFKVRAKLSTGDYSKYSTVVAAGQLTGLNAKVSGTTAKLSWTKLSGAKTYYIYQSTSKTSGFKKVASTTGTSYSVKSLTKGKTYYFKVRAKLSTGDYSAYAAVVKAAISNKKSAALASVQSVAPVQKLSAAVSGQSVKLSWEKLSGAKSYEVYRSASAKSGFEKIGTTEKTSCKITKQNYGKTLYFKVRALLSDGSYSEFSTAVKAVIPAAPTAVPTAVPTIVPTAAPVKPAANAANTNAGNLTEECSEDGSSCTMVEKVCTETECTITSKVCVVIGDQKACAEPVVTVVPVLTETPVVTVTPTVEVTPTEEAAVTETPAAAEQAAEVTEECSEDGSTCTVYEKVCTEAECTITSKVCVVIGDQKACAEPMVTVVPVMTETPAMTEETPAAEPAATEEAPAEPAVTEESPAEPVATEEIPAEPVATEEIPAEPVATEEAPAEPAVTEEIPAEPTAMEEVPAEPAATEEAPAEPAATEEAPAEPTVTEEVPAEPAATEVTPEEPTATEEAPAEPVVTEEVPTEPAVTEEIPTESVAAEEIPAAEEAVSVDAAPVEDLTIREISIEDLAEDTITFSALESYTIAPEKLKVVPEAADWAELTFKLDDESIASFKSTDIEVIKAEGLTLNGLQAGTTMLRIQAGEVEKTVTLVINLSAAEIQTAQEAVSEPIPENSAE